MPQLILASKSPRREKLLRLLGLDFKIITADVDESISPIQPALFAEQLALRKAEKVAAGRANSLVIGADTIVVHAGQILGKPRNPAEAFTMLSALSASVHHVITGVALIQTNGEGNISSQKVFHEQTKVQFSPLSEQEINIYIESGSPMDKAGAYGIQDDMGALFVKAIEGDYYNIVGLPLNRLYNEMKTFSTNLAHAILQK